MKRSRMDMRPAWAQQCPTCGNRPYVRVRKGGIARIVGGLRSIRVYWPIAPGFRSTYVGCPNPFHTRPAPPKEPETFTTVNVHARPARLSARRQAKESRHRERQGKDRR